MSPMVLGLVLLHLLKCYNCALEENVKKESQSEGSGTNKMAETIEVLVKKVASLENVLENKNLEVAKLERQVGEIGARVDEGLKVQCGAELNKTLDEVLPKAIQEGLRDLPLVMVCAAVDGYWNQAESVVTYDRIVSEHNNFDKPGGGDGMMDIETGVFTVLTSGYYIITYSGNAI